MLGHKQRVGCMSWSHHTLATGSRDRTILMRDVRSQEPYSHKLNGHRSEICGIKWSPDDRCACGRLGQGRAGQGREALGVPRPLTPGRA